MLAAAALGVALPPAPAEGSATLGWVQGGAPGGGIYGIGSARSTTIRHANKTLDLARRHQRRSGTATRCGGLAGERH